MSPYNVANAAAAWIKANRMAQQDNTLSAYRIARLLGYEKDSVYWEFAVQGAAQYLIKGEAI